MNRSSKEVLMHALQDLGRYGLLCAGIATLTVVTIAAGPAPLAQTPLTATVTWTDAAGDAGTMDFQGTADGSTLRGIVSAQGEEITVTGTISETGAVSGTLTRPAGSSVGTFSGQLDAEQQLQGGYFVLNGTGGSWTAPADAMPLPE
jgi:hypothetical protein